MLADRVIKCSQPKATTLSVLVRHGKQCTTIVCQLFLGHSVYMYIHNIRLYAQYTMQNGLFPVYFH